MQSLPDLASRFIKVGQCKALFAVDSGGLSPNLDRRQNRALDSTVAQTITVSGNFSWIEPVRSPQARFLNGPSGERCLGQLRVWLSVCKSTCGHILLCFFFFFIHSRLLAGLFFHSYAVLRGTIPQA